MTSTHPRATGAPKTLHVVRVSLGVGANVALRRGCTLWSSDHGLFFAGQCYDPVKRTSSGCTQTHMSPDGVFYASLLPNAPNYSNPNGGVLQGWRGMARWFTNQCLIRSQNKTSGVLLFDDKVRSLLGNRMVEPS